MEPGLAHLQPLRPVLRAGGQATERLGSPGPTHPGTLASRSRCRGCSSAGRRCRGLAWTYHGRLRMLTHSNLRRRAASGPQAAPGPLGQSESNDSAKDGAGFSGHLGGADPPWPRPLCPPANWPNTQSAGELARPGSPLSSAAAAACRPEGGQGRLGVPRAEGAASTLHPHPCMLGLQPGRVEREPPQSTVCPLPTLPPA